MGVGRTYRGLAGRDASARDMLGEDEEDRDLPELRRQLRLGAAQGRNRVLQ